MLLTDDGEPIGPEALSERVSGMVELPVVLNDPPRPIGLTLRRGWVPTPAQAAMLEALRQEGAALR